MEIRYSEYEDKILGGWVGKSIGGTLGARFECIKAWIDLSIDEIIPEQIPPNDDLDLQVLWLKVLEEKGPALTSDDLAQAWLDGCWYPFNEYGNFRRNFRNGVKPPYTGRHDNTFFESGMGCPIRSEIWGYVFPGAPELAARYAWLDGTLDHTDESVCPEQMFSAMAADAFFESDLQALARRHMHRLKPGLMVTRLVEAAFAAHEEGLPLKEARDRVHLLGGHPEPCDAQLNVPFTFLALLYGEYDLEKTILAALQCGYDTDCTLATAGAFVGQVLGANAIPARMRDIIGDDLVMGIEYRRQEMTLSALARDTARVGLKLAAALDSAVEFDGAPDVEPYPDKLCRPRPSISVDYVGAPAAAPGQAVDVELTVRGTDEIDGAVQLEVAAPDCWQAVPCRTPLNLFKGAEQRVTVRLAAAADAPSWPQGHHFSARLSKTGQTVAEEPFGAAGAMVWRLLGVHFDPCKPEGANGEVTREQLLAGGARAHFGRHYHVAFDREYVDEKAAAADRDAADALYHDVSRLLGRPALIVCPDSFIRPQSLVGLRGEWVCYLDAEFDSPTERDVQFWMGSNDGYRAYLNGELIRDLDVQRWWTPGGPEGSVHLKQGRNRVLLKLLKRGEEIKFSFGVRQQRGTPEFPRRNDWVTDLSWWNPLA